MSPSVMTFPARNFKFLSEGSLPKNEKLSLLRKRVRRWLSDQFPERSAFGGVSGTHETLLLVAAGMEPPLDNRLTTLNPWPGDGTDVIGCRPSFAAAPGNLKR
jgi:hypothetical protein